MFSEPKSDLNRTVLGVHRLHNGEEVQWDTDVALEFCQGICQAREAWPCLTTLTGQGNENFTTHLI